MNPQQDFQAASGHDELSLAAFAARKAAEHLAAVLARTPPQSGNVLVETIKDIEASQKIYEEARQELLPVQMKHNIGLVRFWLAGLQDPQYPDVGLDFLNRFDTAGFKTEADPQLKSSAAYTSFSLRQDSPGFLNEITFGQRAASEPFILFNALVHEVVHGFQKAAAPALHASPYNNVNGNRIIVCPSDWLLLEERCEQDAYAKQGWLNALLAAQHPEAMESGRYSAVSAPDFLSHRGRSGGNLFSGLRESARNALGKSAYSDNENSLYRFAHSVQNQALNNYRAAMITRIERGETGFIFVRLRPEHIHAVGESFGPNVFGCDPSDPALVKGTPMLDISAGTGYLTSTVERFNSMKREFNIPDESKLPYLDEAVAAQGMTLHQFMQHKTAKPAPGFTPNGPAGP